MLSCVVVLVIYVCFSSFIQCFFNVMLYPRLLESQLDTAEIDVKLGTIKGFYYSLGVIITKTTTITKTQQYLLGLQGAIHCFGIFRSLNIV